MDYSEEEEHLRHVDEPAGVQQVHEDLERHFVTAGVQQEGGVDVVMHSALADAKPVEQEAASLGEAPGAQGELRRELEGMAQRHGDDGFTLGVASAEGYDFADEEADAE